MKLNGMMVGALCVLLSCGVKAAPAEEPLPKLETPVLMMGDSMMRLLGKAMEKEFKKADIQPAVAFSSLGSGLVRPSIFNWNKKAVDLCETHHPKTAFVALGTNDRQTLEKSGGGFAEYGTAEWKVEYTKFIETLLVQLKEQGVTHIVWMLLPPMKSAQNQEHAELVNEIVTKLAATPQFKGLLIAYETENAISSRLKKGKFTQTVMSPDGSAVTVRDADGVHLTFAGGTRIARDVIKTYWKNRK